MSADPRTDLLRLINGFQISQAIRTVVELGIADMLRSAPLGIDDLARRTQMHTRSLNRLLRALCSVGVFRFDGHRYALTPLSEHLCTAAGDSLAAWTRLVTRDYLWSAWAALPVSVRTGETAFDHVHGRNVWDYRSQFQDEAAIFNCAMGSVTAAAAAAVVNAYDFAPHSLITDIAGGQGTLLASILAANPSARGILVEQRHVASSAETYLDRCGIGDRCQISTGDFFVEVPADADTYLLKSVLHDWDDEPALTILRNCRRAMHSKSTLLVIEHVLRDMDDVATSLDLYMMVVTGGIERTRDEFADLFGRAGLRLTRVIPTKSALCVLEVRFA
jgi:hypothetical protein